MAKPAEMTGRVLVDELHVSLFPLQVPMLCIDSIVSPLRLRLVEGIRMFRCNLPPDWGLLHATEVTQGRTDTE